MTEEGMMLLTTAKSAAFGVDKNVHARPPRKNKEMILGESSYEECLCYREADTER